MATVTQVSLVDDLDDLDDLDGSKASETVSFSLEGGQYQLDLSEKNAAKLRDALAPFVASARRGKGGGRRSRGGPKMTQSLTTDRERELCSVAVA